MRDPAIPQTSKITKDKTEQPKAWSEKMLRSTTKVLMITVS